MRWPVEMRQAFLSVGSDPRKFGCGDRASVGLTGGHPASVFGLGALGGALALWAWQQPAAASDERPPPSLTTIARGGQLEAHVTRAVLEPRRGQVLPFLRFFDVQLEASTINTGWVRGGWAVSWSPPLPDGTCEETGRFLVPVGWGAPGDPDAVDVTGRVEWRSDLYVGLIDRVALPGGSFVMGSPDDDDMARSSEKPAHPQSVAAFSCARTPTTERQWAMVMGGGIERPTIRRST